MGNYLWYENIEGEWTLVADLSSDDVLFDGVTMGCEVSAHSFGQNQPFFNGKEIYYK
jgi:hypothetical protein